MYDIKTAEAEIESLFFDQLSRKECFGGGAAIIQGDETLFEGYFGDERFSKQSIFRLASVTKLFTAAAFMKLSESGAVNLCDKVSKYLPDFSNLRLGILTPDGRIISGDVPKREITLFDLLTHTAGIGADILGNREYDIMPKDEKNSLSAVCDYYGKNFHLAFEPGEKAAYSGFAGYDIIARIIELQSGKSFGEYLAESFFKPLGMYDTAFAPSEEQYKRLVPMHKRISGRDIEVDYHGTVWRGLPTTYEMAGASLVSSLPDTVKFCKMLLCGGKSNGISLISEDSVKQMISPKLFDGLLGLSSGENNAFGCFTVTGKHRLPKGSVYIHGAYGTHIFYLPKSEVLGIFFKNSYFDMSLTSRSTVMFEKALLLSKDSR